MKQTTLALSAAAIAFVGGASILQAADPAPARATEPRMDMNRTMTRAEMLAHADTMFTAMDVNKDGKIDQADRAARQTERFDRIDADKNGQISRGEFAGQRSPAPPAGTAGQPGAMVEHRMGAHAGHMRGKMPGRMHGGAMGMMMLRTADADKNGAVTKAEFTAAATAHFDQVDTNKDGQVTPQERQAAHAVMRERMRDMRGAGGPHAGMAPPSPAASPAVPPAGQ